MGADGLKVVVKPVIVGGREVVVNVAVKLAELQLPLLAFIIK